MKIRTLDEIGEETWNALVIAAPEGSFFHLAQWKSVVSAGFGFQSEYLAVEDATGIVGILPLFVARRGPLGTALLSTPLCSVGGAISLYPEAAEFLEKAAIHKAARLGVDFVELRCASRRLEGWATHEQFYSFMRPILNTEEANFLAIPRKQRAVVRKALSLGLTNGVDCDIDGFYSLYANSMHRLGTPAYPKRYMESLATIFKKQIEIVTVRHEGRAVSAMLCFHFNDQVYPYYAGATTDAISMDAQTFTFWSVVQRASELGLKKVDFGRSIRGSGSFDFKVNFGMEKHRMNYQTYLVKAQTHPNMDPRSMQFRLFSNVWKRLPRFVVNRLSPLASRMVV